MFKVKKVKKDSSVYVCSPRKLEHKPPKGLATHVSDGRRSTSVSASIIEFIKPRYSFWESKKNKKDQGMPQPKLEEPVNNNMRDLNLKEWILSSPRTNASASSNSKQSSGRIHPSFEETVDEATTPKILPRDAFCLEGSNLKSNNDVEAVKIDLKMSPSEKRKRRVRFRLPQVVEIFELDSADGYYYSN